ncbi:LPS-assembly protein LptD [Flavobacteriaceae bacterium AU392]|nr:LPS-assembly protein LptD [Flavobacteriaceae bacterium]RKM85688.1 LPS-assembly protein LptD [Flavobacteriaceae bacterium AU392]
MAIQKPSHTFTKIHLKALQTNIFNILFALSFTVFINTFGYTQDVGDKNKIIKPKENDSISNLREQDTIKQDTLKVKKEGALTDKVIYKAKGYIASEGKKAILYDEAKVNYGVYEITAGIIVIDNATGLVYAGRIKDSSGVYLQKPIFKQGGQVIESDSIQFNIESKKALIWNSKTEQEGGTIFPELSKKENDSTFYISNAKFTTSETPEDPEYYFLVRKGKVVPGKKIVTGLTNLFIADVPTPIGVPFAYFPLTKKQTSGVIFPTFGEQNERGYFIQNGGYYFAISDYLDLAVLGDYYTNGSYALNLESNYRKRYNYNGIFSFRFENLLISERGFPDFSQSEIYNLRWTHRKDAKSNPNSTFSASVNIGSSTFFQESLNQLTTSSFLNNTLTSSVSYSRRFQTVPEVRFSLTATHSQNTQTESINLTLPTFQASVDRIFPFAPKVGSKKGIIQNINLQYNVRAENRIQTTDSDFFTSRMFDNALIGARHTIPINTNFKLLKHLSFSANANFEETWTLNTINRFFDETTQEIVTEDIDGFDSFRTYNFSANLGTTIYGQANFGENSKLQAIRHVIRPSISYSINPAFNQFFDNVEVVDANGTTVGELEQEFSRFEGSLFGAPGNQFSSNIGLTVSNNIEAKIRSKNKDGKIESKKIVIFNNLNLSTNYNISADSLNLSPIRVTGGTKLFKDLDINFGATFDPYALDNNNNRINTFNINAGGGLARLTTANATASYNFSSKSFSNKRQKNEAARQESLRNGGREDDLFGVSQNFANQQFNQEEENKKEPDQKNSEFYNFKIPWSLRLAYTVNYNNARGQNEIASHSIMASGDIQLSPRWSIGVSSGYDVLNKGVTFTQFRFTRDLESWRMDFTWVPFSTRSSWNFFIGVKAPILEALKYEKRRERDRQL